MPTIVTAGTFACAGQRLEDNKRYAARDTRVPSLLQGLAACSACGYGIDVEVVSKDPPPAFPRRNIAQTRGQDMDCIWEATGWPANRGSCVAEGWTQGGPAARRPLEPSFRSCRGRPGWPRRHSFIVCQLSYSNDRFWPTLFRIITKTVRTEQTSHYAIPVDVHQEVV